MNKQKKHLIEILAENMHVPQGRVQEVLALLAETDKNEQEIILERGIVSEDRLAEAIATKYDIPMVVLNGLSIPESIQSLVEISVLRKYRVMPFEFAADGSNTLYVATADPMNINALDDISIVTGMHVEPYVSTSSDIMSAIDRYYGRSETMSVAEQYAKEREKNAQNDEAERMEAEINSSPIVVIVNSMIEQAARQRASDIHVEPMEDAVRVRYRIDGVLYNRVKYATQLAAAIIARIKIISGMDISEKRKPQDGRATCTVDHREYDIRVSCLPTVFGEKCVLRLQVKQDFTRDKRLLGFNDFCHLYRSYHSSL